MAQRRKHQVSPQLWLPTVMAAYFKNDKLWNPAGGRSKRVFDINIHARTAHWSILSKCFAQILGCGMAHFFLNTAIHVVRLRARFPMVSLKFFIDLILPVAMWLCGRLSLQQKWVPGLSPEGLRRPVLRADNLATFMCRCSTNPGSLNQLESSGPVQACVGVGLF